MKSLQVIRTHSSAYHGPDFELHERKRLEQIPGVTVEQLANADISKPTVLITNTHTVLKNLPAKLLQNTKQ